MLGSSRGALSHPQWQGPQKGTIYIIFASNIIFIPYFILSVVEINLFKKWVPEHWNVDNDVLGFYLRSGMQIMAQSLFILVTTPVILLKPFHPLLANLSTFVLFGLWTFSAVYTAIATYSNEYSFDMRDRWDALGFAETGLASVLAVSFGVAWVLSFWGVKRRRALEREGGTAQGVNWGRERGAKKGGDALELV